MTRKETCIIETTKNNNKLYEWLARHGIEISDIAISGDYEYIFVNISSEDKLALSLKFNI